VLAREISAARRLKMESLLPRGALPSSVKVIVSSTCLMAVD